MCFRTHIIMRIIRSMVIIIVSIITIINMINSIGIEQGTERIGLYIIPLPQMFASSCRVRLQLVG